MSILKRERTSLLFAHFLVFAIVRCANAQTLVPALITFGDSGMDVGNNNYLSSFYKANYAPYGRDFTNHQSTGRFTNGKLVSDLTAESLGFTSYPLAYLDPRAKGENLLIGASFASAASGYDEQTARLNHAISLSQQLRYFQEYIKNLEKIAGPKNASSIVKGALYVLGFGTADFNQNYYVNPYTRKLHGSPDQYSTYLLRKLSYFVKDLYRLGARRIGVTSLFPLGCCPAARALYGDSDGIGRDGCVDKHNYDAQVFNKKLNATVNQLLKQSPDLKMAVFDIFKPLYDLVKTPSHYGFKEASRGCCRTGRGQNTAYLCNKRLSVTCKNASQYVFWDGVHLSEAANQYVSGTLIGQGISLIF